MNYRERIRKAIECPQFGDETYGEWGILNLEQRKFIKRLLDELDRADNYIKKVYFENKQLKDNWNKLKEYCKENTLCYEVGDDENTKLIGSKIHGLNVLDKMQEMEKNYGNVEDNT